MGLKFTKMNWNSGYNEFSKDIDRTKKEFRENGLTTPSVSKICIFLTSFS